MPETGDLVGDYVDVPHHTLAVRVAPVLAGADPRGEVPDEPLWGLYVSAMDTEPGWLAINAVPFEDLAGAQRDLQEDTNQHRFLQLSILIGASWSALEASASRVARAQESAVLRLPPNVYTANLEELRAVRSMINNADPGIVAALLGMTYHWQTDPGGTNGPAHYA